MDTIEKAGQKIIPYVRSIKDDVLTGPISLHVLLTDYCVNQCNMCGHWKTQDKKQFSLNDVEMLFREADSLRVESVCFTGGDPVCHPDFEEILKLRRNFDLGIITSGNFAKDFDYSLLKHLAWVRFSIDSLDYETYKKIRGRDNLDEIIDNLRKAIRFNKHVGINFTMQKMNFIELADMIKFCEDLGVHRLISYPVHNFPGYELDENDTKQICNIIQVYHKWQRIPETNLQFLYDYYTGRVKFKKPHKEIPCIINKVHLAINASGDVFPCEVIADDTDVQDKRDICLGNMFKENLYDIWYLNYDNEFISEKCKLCFSRYLPINEMYHKMKDNKIFI